MIYIDPDVTAVIAEDEKLRSQAAGQPIGKPAADRPSVAEVVAMFDKLTDDEKCAFYHHVMSLQ